MPMDQVQVARVRNPLFACLVVLGMLGLTRPTPGAAAPDDDPDALAPGVVVRFTSDAAPGVEAHRISPDFAWNWGSGSPDARLPAENFRLVATGSLLIQAPGAYRVFAESDGRVVIRINGVVVDSGPSSPPIELRPGFVPIRLEYRHERGRARLAVQWEGPGFAREPLPARLLYHDPATAPPADRFEEGRRLADRLGCANCHATLDLPTHRALGPPLADSARSIEPRWLSAWLKDPASVRPRARMPAFGRGLSDADAADLAAFLARMVSKGQTATAEVRMALNVASPEKGRLLFHSLGCLGCHGRGEPRAVELPVAPDLADVGRKRSPEAIAAYLEHPRSSKTPIPSKHRPDLHLTADESAQLAVFLSEGVERPNGINIPMKAGDPDRGQALVDRLRCTSCHAIPNRLSRANTVPLRGGTRADAGCLASEPLPGREDVPRFALTPAERESLRAFVSGLPAQPAPSGPEGRALDTIRRLNCLGCHVRDGQGGRDLSSRLAPLLGQDQALGGLKGTLTPPNLTAVGDKLRPEYLALAVRGEAPTARPWLSARMPSFAFEPNEADAIAEALRGHDRMRAEPESSPAHAPTRLEPATRDLAARLIAQRGFGCLSCHVLAGRVPPGGEPETLGPDLALSHRRMTERYFRRWIADPQRIIAGTPMPQFLKPIEGVPGTLDDQLLAIWRLLGSDVLTEVAATGTREILKREGDRALVVRDMVLVPGLPDTPYTPRGLAVGLKNDASLLFDTDQLAWLASWRGGFLSRTKSGRLWEWHPEGTPLWTAARRLPPVVLVAADGSVLMPSEVRSRYGTFRVLEFVADSVRLSYRLHFPESTQIDVTEDILPAGLGWQRLVHVESAPRGYIPALVEQLPVAGGEAQVSWPVGTLRVSIEGVAPGPPRLPIPGAPGAVAVRLVSDGKGGFTGRVSTRIEEAR
jgi:mono/diheme cytochrome c family protein